MAIKSSILVTISVHGTLALGAREVRRLCLGVEFVYGELKSNGRQTPHKVVQRGQKGVDNLTWSQMGPAVVFLSRRISRMHAAQIRRAIVS